MDRSEAEALASAWVAAWNQHDLEAVMAHYHEDVVFRSPYVAVLGTDSSGVIRGRDRLREYFARALELVPEIRFDLLEVATGVDSLDVLYRNHRDELVVEVLTLRDELAAESTAHYVPAAARLGAR